MRFPRVRLLSLRALGRGLLLVGAAALVGPAQAQQAKPGLLTGRVVTADGTPLGDAVLKATQGPRTVSAQSTAAGEYRLGGLGTGRWSVSVRRLGFLPRIVEVELPGDGLRTDITLEARSTASDAALTAAGWVGIRGVVGDARSVTPLAGALVRLLGSDTATTSDSVGEFALPLPRARDVVLRVERMGYTTQVVTATVPPGEFVTVLVGLDSASTPSLDAWAWKDLDARLKYATPRAAMIGFAELQASNMPTLWSALENATTIRRQRIVITRAACIFINGIPRPGVPVDAIFTREVEFVEVYPPGSEITRTLMRAWPLGGACGVRDNSAMRFSDSRQTAQFISVWQRP
ncbi:MAG: carboxypeptidase regulatory-like domain-containing protein [Gemmatimonadota bacterium]|nr:carboxypeptidase regulatory-like domain-containing protein [Gemmatimonadota bacterium]